MQTHNYQQFRRVLQNPLVTLPFFMCLLRAEHSRFNQVKSLFGVRKSLLTLSHFLRVCPLMQRGRGDGRSLRIRPPLAAGGVRQRCASRRTTRRGGESVAAAAAGGRRRYDGWCCGRKATLAAASAGGRRYDRWCGGRTAARRRRRRRRRQGRRRRHCEALMSGRCFLVMHIWPVT